MGPPLSSWVMAATFWGAASMPWVKRARRASSSTSEALPIPCHIWPKWLRASALSGMP
ncbi:hypothetical protein D3C87_1804600 [compost metagenome]